MYYKDGVTKPQAITLCGVLVDLGVFSGKSVTKVQVLKESGIYVLRLPVAEEIWTNEKIRPEIAASGEYVSQKVFDGAPVAIELCTEDLDPQTRVKTFREFVEDDPETAKRAQKAFLSKLRSN